MTANVPKPKPIKFYCHFCGANEHETRLVCGPAAVAICGLCIALAAATLARTSKDARLINLRSGQPAASEERLTMTRRTLPLALAVPVSAGSDPDVIEIDDATEAIGDWPEIEELCISTQAPAGQCEYSWRDNWTRCMYCGRASELDR